MGAGTSCWCSCLVTVPLDLPDPRRRLGVLPGAGQSQPGGQAGLEPGGQGGHGQQERSEVPSCALAVMSVPGLHSAWLEGAGALGLAGLWCSCRQLRSTQGSAVTAVCPHTLAGKCVTLPKQLGASPPPALCLVGSRQGSPPTMDPQALARYLVQLLAPRPQHKHELLARLERTRGSLQNGAQLLAVLEQASGGSLGRGLCPRCSAADPAARPAGGTARARRAQVPPAGGAAGAGAGGLAWLHAGGAAAPRPAAAQVPGPAPAGWLEWGRLLPGHRRVKLKAAVAPAVPPPPPLLSCSFLPCSRKQELGAWAGPSLVPRQEGAETPAQQNTGKKPWGMVSTAGRTGPGGGCGVGMDPLRCVPAEQAWQHLGKH